MMAQEEEASALPQGFLLKSLGVAFALWAAVVAWGVDRVTTEMDRQGERQERAYLEFKNYVAFTEARLTKLEAEARAAEIERARRDNAHR